MLLFVLRCSFWMAVVAMALPWFTADNGQTGSDAVASRPVVSAKAQIARAVPAPRYFDDTTASLSPAPGCADRATDCGESAPKVDLIALQLESRDRAPPKAAPSRTTSASVSGRASAPRHAARRAASIGDLLAR